MSSQELIDALADRAYAAMWDATRWPSFLIHLTNALGGCSPTLFRHDAGNHAGSLDIAVDHDPALSRAYKTHLSRCNVWLRGGVQRLTIGQVRTSHMMCSRRELLQSQWWTDYCRPMGITQGIGATILRTGDLTYNVTVFADDSRAAFGERDLRLLSAVMPHLQRALGVSTHFGEIERNRQCLADALDTVPTAVFLVAATGRVLFCNRAAEHLVALCQGLSITKEGLAADSPAETAALRALIGRAARRTVDAGADAGGTMRLARDEGRAPLEVLVSPVRQEDAHPLIDTTVALVHVSDPEAVALHAAETLRQRFRLTPAEVRVALWIGRGSSVAQIAARLHLSIHTVRTQLKSVMAKTDSVRQSDLVRLLVQSATDPR